MTYNTNTLQEYPSYYAPVTALEGALFVNTEAMQELNLPMPISIADLADPYLCWCYFRAGYHRIFYLLAYGTSDY